MALDANTNVAAAAALYFTDNFTALQQAGTAMVAQANQMPQGVLALLR